MAGALLLGGCGGGPRNDDIDVPASSGADSGTSGATTEGSGPSIKLDLGVVTDLGVGEVNCSAVDFLFVIDNSSSMLREQERLVEAVPGFTASILSALPGISDVRVGVVDTDSYPGLGAVDPLDGCPDGVDCSVCDYQLGALLTRPGSAIDLAEDCQFATGEPWMDARLPSFADEFACAANVGIEGNQVEQQAGALVEALSPAFLQGGCNDGFLRDEALLIVLLITDEEDDNDEEPGPQGGSLDDPSDWHGAVLAAKGGEENNVVALGLFGGDPLFDDCEQLGAGGSGAEASPRLTRFLDRFEVSFAGSVCQDDYRAFFDDALNRVAQGCAQFVPG